MEGNMKKTQCHPAKTNSRSKWISSLSLYFLVVLTLLWGHAVYAETMVNRIVAQVNDDIITLYDLNQAIEPYMQKIKGMGYPPLQEREMIYKIRAEMLDDLIANKLTEQVAKEKGLNVSDKEIEAAIDRVRKTNFLTEEQFRDALARDGIDYEEYRKNAHEQILRSKLVNQEVQSKIVVTQEDVQAYYDKNIDKYAGKKKLHLRTIIKMVPEMASEKDVQSIISRMDNILSRLDAGEPFIEMAKKHSDLLAEEGGDIGDFEEDGLSEEIKKAVTALKPGEHTRVIDTPQGLQIFYLQEIIDSTKEPVDSVSDEIRDILYKQVVDQKFKEWIENLKKQAHIKVME